MSINKKVFLGGFLIISLFTIKLGSAIAYPAGFAQGEIIAFYKNYALLVFDTSQRKGMKKSSLLAVDYINKQFLWETRPIGFLEKFVQTYKNRFITIEGNHLVSRDLRNGNIKWKINLITITTNHKDLIPVGDYEKDRLREAVWRIYNNCIQYPNKVKFFKYKIFLPTIDHLILFRVARYGHDGPYSNEKDFIEINLQSGKIVKKGCYHFMGFSEKVSIITDFRVLYKLNDQGLYPLKGSEKILKLLGFPYSHQNFSYDESVSKDWFFIYNNHTRDDDCIMIFNSKNNEIKTFNIPWQKDYNCSVVAAGNYLINFSRSSSLQKKMRKQNRVFWVELFDLKGNLIKKIENKTLNSFRASFLGRTGNNDVLLKINCDINQFSIPDLELISKFRIPEKETICEFNINKYRKNILVSEYQDKLVVGYIIGNFWTGYMKNKKNKQIITIKFFNIKNNKKLWSFHRELIFYRIKRKRPY